MGANFKLKGLRVTRDKTQQEIAKVLGISDTSYCMKEKRYHNRDFSREEIQNLYEYFKLTPIELVDIFFTKEVHAKRTKRSNPA